MFLFRKSVMIIRQNRFIFRHGFQLAANIKKNDEGKTVKFQIEKFSEEIVLETQLSLFL